MLRIAKNTPVYRHMDQKMHPPTPLLTPTLYASVAKTWNKMEMKQDIFLGTYASVDVVQRSTHLFSLMAAVMQLTFPSFFLHSILYYYLELILLSSLP